MGTYDLKHKLAEFEPWQRGIILENTSRVQLTDGCSIGCSGCGIGAEKGVKSIMPWDLYTELVDEMVAHWVANGTTPYWKNEPFDYHSQGKNFRDAYFYLGGGDLIYNFLSESIYVQTAVPKGSEQEVLASLDIVNDINITLHKTRLKNFISKVFEVCDDNANPLRICTWQKLGPKHINNLAKDTLSCEHGVVLTPSNIYTIRSVRPSTKHPYGYIQEEVIPDNFIVNSLSWDPQIYAREIDPKIRDKLHNEWLDEAPLVIDSEEKRLSWGPRMLQAYKYALKGELTSDKESWSLFIKENIRRFRNEKKDGFSPFEEKIFDEAELMIEEAKQILLPLF